jgi:hypothetical protein
MGRIDAAAAARHFARGDESVLGDPGSRFLWAGGGMATAWPAAPDEDAYSRPRDSDVQTLVISGTLDGATPAANATRDLMPRLRNGRQVLLSGFGHTTDFWNVQVSAGNHLINQYLDTGKVDASRYVPQKVDFTPALKQTTLARGLLGAMAGLALVTLLSLAWMAIRVHTRGHLGRRARVVVRSAWALVLGLGGWFAVALFALVALPSVPIDAALPMIAGMAAPVALAGYWAWRDPSRVPTRTTGFASAVAGALLGAGIGFTCGTAMTAIATTLIGAVAGMNLALIACDIAVETRRRRQAPEPQVAEPPREPVLV